MSQTRRAFVAGLATAAVCAPAVAKAALVDDGFYMPLPYKESSAVLIQLITKIGDVYWMDASDFWYWSDEKGIQILK